MKDILLCYRDPETQSLAYSNESFIAPNLQVSIPVLTVETRKVKLEPLLVYKGWGTR